MAAVDRIKEFLRPGPNMASVKAELDVNEQELSAIKAQLLRQVQAQAGDGQATLQDYYNAAREYATTHHLNIDAFADLRGQNIENMRICDPKLQATHGNGDKNLNFYDRDSDGAIGDFYTNLNLEGATLKNCFVEPAASFNAQIAQAKYIENVTFKDMQQGDHFAFGPGSYNNIRMVDINGGDIAFNNSQVTRLDMHDAKVASFSLHGHSSVRDLNATNASIVQIDADPGTKITHATFEHATVSMASRLDGITLEDVNFDNASLNDVSLRNASITKTTFAHADLRHVDFTGAKLRSVQFTLEPEQLQQLNLDGVDFAQSNDVKVNGLLITSGRDLKAMQAVSQMLPGLKQAMSTEPTPSPAPEPSPAALAAAGASPLKNLISGGEDVGSATLNTAVATLKTAEKDPSQVASPANMAALQANRGNAEGNN